MRRVVVKSYLSARLLHYGAVEIRFRVSSKGSNIFSPTRHQVMLVQEVTDRARLCASKRMLFAFVRPHEIQRHEPTKWSQSLVLVRCQSSSTSKYVVTIPGPVVARECIEI